MLCTRVCPNSPIAGTMQASFLLWCTGTPLCTPTPSSSSSTGGCHGIRLCLKRSVAVLCHVSAVVCGDVLRSQVMYLSTSIPHIYFPHCACFLHHANLSLLDRDRFLANKCPAMMHLNSGRRVPSSACILPFGGGASYCPGRKFARAEIKALVAQVCMHAEYFL